MTIVDKLQKYDEFQTQQAKNKRDEARERRDLDNKHRLEVIQLELRWFMPQFLEALEKALESSQHKLSIRIPSVFRGVNLEGPEIRLPRRDLFNGASYDPIPNPFWGYKTIFQANRYQFYAGVVNIDNNSTDLHLKAEWNPVGRYWDDE